MQIQIDFDPERGEYHVRADSDGAGGFALAQDPNEETAVLTAMRQVRRQERHVFCPFYEYD